MGFIKNFLGGRLEVTNTPPRQQEHIIVVDEKKPSPMAIIYSLTRGEEIEVLDISDGFAHVKYNGQDGYASTKYLRKK